MDGAFAVVSRPLHQIPTSTFAPDLRGLGRQPTLEGQTANVSQRITLPPDDFFDKIRRRPQQQMGSSRMDAVEIGSSQDSSSLDSIKDTQADALMDTSKHNFPEDVQSVAVYHLNPLTGGHEIAVESVATEVRMALAKIHDAHNTLVHTDRGSTYKCVFLGTKKQVVYWTIDHEKERACKSCFNAHRVCFRFLETGKYLALPLPDVLYEDDFQPDDLAFFQSDQSAKSRNMKSEEIWQKMPSKA
ncbi:hypothetical protein TI39_contig4316g00001 [Zymoseptoria brevis]|uniref:Uncharacterized protein n=1 Tax=Zymoseptoria brevis TaxID=1047168 RepID=A0A0F4G8X9_9PEZI|nr:hypothetical protein TI39_contig4316g00001 [Zymoseptoria brevis]